MRIFIIAMLTVTAVSFSETVTQTDWSGGAGVQGPVTNWGNSYDVSDQINDSGDSLQLLWGIIAVPEKHTVDDFYNGAYSVYAADIDADGDADILGAARGGTGQITWWENTNGLGTSWIERTIDENFDSALAVHAADVDGDGDMDVLGAAQGADDITWWENTDGTGISWSKHTIDGNFDCAYSVHAVDVDDDTGSCSPCR